MADGVKCVDVDECMKTPDVCDHSCVNSDGSYKCSCNQGYVLDPDGHRCKITGKEDRRVGMGPESFQC